MKIFPQGAEELPLLTVYELDRSNRHAISYKPGVKCNNYITFLLSATYKAERVIR